MRKSDDTKRTALTTCDIKFGTIDDTGIGCPPRAITATAIR